MFLRTKFIANITPDFGSGTRLCHFYQDFWSHGILHLSWPFPALPFIPAMHQSLSAAPFLAGPSAPFHQGIQQSFTAPQRLSVPCP